MEWEAALQAVLEARKRLGQQHAQSKYANKRRNQLDRRLLGVEQTICWLIMVARDEAKNIPYESEQSI